MPRGGPLPPQRRDAVGERGAGRLADAAFVLLLLFVATAPLLSGPRPEANPAAWGRDAATIAEITPLLLFGFVIASSTFFSGSPLASPRRLAIPLAAAAGLALLGVVQIVPLPEGLLRTVAPANVQIYHDTAEILRLFGDPAPLRPRISLAPGETLVATLSLLAAAALFYCAAGLLKDRRRRRWLLAVLIGSALVQLVVAAIRAAGGGPLRGTLPSPGDLAGYLEIALAVTFGTLWAEVLTNRDRAGEAVRESERFERRFSPLAARGLVFGLIAAGLLATKDRAAILAAGVTLPLLTIAALFHRRARGRRRAAVGAFFALLLGLFLLAAGAVGGGRLFRFLDAGAGVPPGVFREESRKTAVAAWRQSPLLGSGLGAFRDAFRRAQPRSLEGVVEHAGDDALELLVTGGAVGLILALTLLLSLFVLLFRRWRRQMHREESALALAGLGALLSLSLHGLSEMNLSVPAVSGTLAAVLGAAWASGSAR
jgi:O-antigen ligase